MVEEMMLSAPDGAQLLLMDLTPGPDYFTADGYTALKRYPKGTHFTVRIETRSGVKVQHLQNQQTLFAGFNAHPGDPKHFGQLSEPALFLQTGVTDG